MRYGRHVLAATLGASLMFSGVAMGVASIAPVAQAQEIGASTMAVVDVDFLNVRQTPSLSGAVVTTLAFGDEVEVATGPVAADGYDWYRLQQDGAFIGWSVAGFLRVGDGEVSTPVIDWTYGDTVTVSTDFLNIRATPSSSGDILDVYEVGFEAVITGDATTVDGIVWYPIDNLGWVAGQYLSTGDGSGEGDGSDGSDDGSVPAGDWVYGDVVIVNTDLLNVRERPSITASVLDVYEFGDEATVTGDAVSADGLTWFPLNNLGWVSGEFLADGGGSADPAPGDGSGEPSGDFVYGSVVLVDTDLLNVRSLPALGADIVDVYPQGTEATITGDATPVDGVVWYPVDNTGWVDGQYLTFVSGTSASPSGSVQPSGSAQPSGSTDPVASASASGSGAPGTSARPSGSSASSASASASGSVTAPASTSAQPSSSASGSATPSGSASPSAVPDQAGFADGDKVTVNATRLNVRAEAASTGAILRIVDLGTEFTIVGEAVSVDGVDWYNVGTGDDEEWVVGEFLTLSEE